MNLTLDANQYWTEANGEEHDTDIYRAWLRLSGSQYELRLGRQKINFGSAMYFRPLMWFNQMDARDPLQIAEGVWGVLGRYYFLNNTNVWLWGLYGNDELKGWEFLPTTDESFEFGGRVQAPFLTGELALSSHYRKIVLDGILQDSPEYRVGLDGKWDIGIGLWFEGAFTYQDYSKIGFQWEGFQQYQLTVGADYTFGIGNGLTTTLEYFHYESTLIRSSVPLVYELSFYPSVTPPVENQDFTALGLNYPLGLVDYLSAVVYYDMQAADWYRFIDWQRTLNDNWMLHMIGYWNPDNAGIFSAMNSGQTVSGMGFQLLLVCNF
jgi:hypothetical protein